MKPAAVIRCHEASHSLAAKLGGDPTAFHDGQVALNPIPHMRREPVGMLLVPIWASPRIGTSVIPALAELAKMLDADSAGVFNVLFKWLYGFGNNQSHARQKPKVCRKS